MSTDQALALLEYSKERGSQVMREVPLEAGCRGQTQLKTAEPTPRGGQCLKHIMSLGSITLGTLLYL